MNPVDPVTNARFIAPFSPTERIEVLLGFMQHLEETTRKLRTRRRCNRPPPRSSIQVACVLDRHCKASSDNGLPTTPSPVLSPPSDDGRKSVSPFFISANDPFHLRESVCIQCLVSKVLSLIQHSVWSMSRPRTSTASTIADQINDTAQLTHPISKMPSDETLNCLPLNSN